MSNSASHKFNDKNKSLVCSILLKEFMKYLSDFSINILIAIFFALLNSSGKITSFLIVEKSFVNKNYLKLFITKNLLASNKFLFETSSIIFVSKKIFFQYKKK